MAISIHGRWLAFPDADRHVVTTTVMVHIWLSGSRPTQFNGKNSDQLVLRLYSQLWPCCSDYRRYNAEIAATPPASMLLSSLRATTFGHADFIRDRNGRNKIVCHCIRGSFLPSSVRYDSSMIAQTFASNPAALSLWRKFGMYAR
jgi:hypothetical protein